MTGKYKSREMDEILEECRLLVRSGVKEILVMAQDLTCLLYTSDAADE